VMGTEEIDRRLGDKLTGINREQLVMLCDPLKFHYWVFNWRWCLS
jgi:hypothetical protein